MYEVQQWGALWTTSMAVTENSHLWNLLAYNCVTGTWRAAINEFGIVASCSTMITEETKKIVHKHVLSCAFDAAEELLEMVNSEGMVI
jgi:hypothetical protein